MYHQELLWGRVICHHLLVSQKKRKSSQVPALPNAMVLRGGSFVVAAVLFFLNTVLNKGIVQLLSNPLNPPTDVTPIDLGRMWVTMAGQTTDPWTVMAVLLALFMVSVTFFVAAVFATSKSGTPHYCIRLQLLFPLSWYLE